MSAPVRSSDSAKISKNVASLVDRLEKKFLLGGCSLSVSDVISGGLFGHLGPLCLALGANR